MAVVRRALASALLVMFGTSCGTTAAAVQTDADRQTCETEGRAALTVYSNSLTLAAALPTTAGAVAQWEYTRNGPNGPRPLVSQWSVFPSSQKVVLCYFDGDFANFSPPGPPGARVYERALVIATEGRSPRFDHIGPKASIPPTAP